MDSEQKYLRNSISCAGKRKFESRVSAVCFLRKVKEGKIKGKAGFQHDNAEVYQCAACLFYHIGHANPDDTIRSWV